ncbi:MULTISPECIES: GGDEF domain-containing protein [unclassified Fibrobacter]|jgi:diguanylate cyclase (GGDEF)-like protein|uniref:GGDEF domain-containing protein n=1 Tax=unclassified Fibrobacter TaxID=2634177 RepID=UPI001566DC50|nr:MULTISPECIES: GGDEF domain-containing protein [unclassified Fibrobacter]
MSVLSYIFWLIVFVGGVVAAYMVPDNTLALHLKFVLIGAWGSVLGLVYHSLCNRKLREAEENFTEALNDQQRNNSPKTEYIPVVPSIGDEPQPFEAPAARKPFDSILPPENKPASIQNLAVPAKISFPLEAWELFCKPILKNRPFPEVVEALEKTLPELFPTAAGILYMYGGTQTELHKILSFGDYVISDDTIMPAECASFNLGEIVITDFASNEMNGGCTHLHHHPQGISFCAPIEGLEEHFGILSIQLDKIPDGETLDFWKTKVGIVAATFGLYVANQNLNIRFQQHSIRDNLTGLFNRRYMEESLRREVSAANRHGTPIGIVMIYPDQVANIQKEKGHHAVEQMLWELGQRLPNFIRTEDIPCRYDGEVLCVILPGADKKITLERAERIRREISQLQVAYGDGILATTLSLGVSVMPDHAIDEGTLIYNGQRALQLAMENGGNRVVSADAVRQY